jgi:hypothetical protein
MRLNVSSGNAEIGHRTARNEACLLLERANLLAHSLSITHNRSRREVLRMMLHVRLRMAAPRPPWARPLLGAARPAYPAQNGPAIAPGTALLQGQAAGLLAFGGRSWSCCGLAVGDAAASRPGGRSSSISNHNVWAASACRCALNPSLPECCPTCTHAGRFSPRCQLPHPAAMRSCETGPGR